MYRKLLLTVVFSLSTMLFLPDFCFGQQVSLLPAPTGKYAVGRQLFVWTDQSRHDPASEDLATRRRLAVYLWYPASSAPETSAPYLTPAQLQIGAFANAYGKAWSTVQGGAVTTHAWENAKLANARRPFPVLVFSPGLGLPTAAYTFLLEDLASHGYVVAAIEHTHVTAPVAFPDGTVVSADFNLGGPPLADSDQVDLTSREMRVLDLCAADVKFVLDQLTKLDNDRASKFFRHLDTQHAGVFGHSVGGRVAVRACQRDTRFRACLNEDGTVFFQPFVPDDTGKPLAQPFMMIDHKDAPFSDSMFQQMHTTREQYEEMRADKIEAAQQMIYRAVLGGSYDVTINVPDAVHGSFSDIALLRTVTPTQSDHQLRIMQLDRLYTRRFFDIYLTGNRSELLTDSNESDVTVKSFQPSVSLPR